MHRVPVEPLENICGASQSPCQKMEYATSMAGVNTSHASLMLDTKWHHLQLEEAYTISAEE